MNREHSISMEISGKTAMWTRPDTGDTPVSYPAPTYAAVKGIFECILLSDWAEVVPTKVEICKPIVYHGYSTNYLGPLRDQSKEGSYRLLATVLADVCYRIYATLGPIPENYARRGNDEMKRQPVGTTSGPHAYTERFERRLKKGQLYSTPCLGWKEFTPDYVGPFRSETMVCDDINTVIPSMLRTCVPSGRGSRWDPRFYTPERPAEIKKGVLCYVE
jgi:CRISPR-associated protein Cas5d